MRLWNAFWCDESGFVLSSEAALVGTVGVLGATVGLSAASNAINDELAEMAYSIRSLDQSYSFEGTRSGSAWTAGSAYTQPPVEESIARLKARMEEDSRRLEQEVPVQPMPASPGAILPQDKLPVPERDLDRRDRERPSA